MDQARKILALIGFAAALFAVGCFGTIGVAAVIFHRPLGTFALQSSSDLASWVQAIGAILAIVFSYRLGASQLEQFSEAARRAEEERMRELAGRQYEVRHAYEAAVRIARFLADFGGVHVADMWDRNYSGELQGALEKLKSVATNGFTPKQIRQLRVIENGTRSIQTCANSHYASHDPGLVTTENRERTARFNAELHRQIGQLNAAYKSFFSE